ncbi:MULTISPECIES: TraG family conjugative transposon ATPase [Bacteroidales]|uniref:TraG family conjugative transposon ATPase n=2 Tax=Bacteroidales TaxID=171549 RepID=A0AC61QUS2_9BACT|nr:MULTISPECIES: TraG family conjugative transposon ATPase [Bacteroidales]ROT06328.1 TraG family conjugative transposon ATPase [Muribaculaceae bacterium Isolate-037 (Harlan)]THG53471.1 TraG family conjugative transposon ATPase [Bacteroidales bacterium]NBH68047.1 TraG family conjugative transposon ATPase [Phocaeicola sartorii]TGX83952.1 TraG family conjugative transposon ATPase [Palleniella muris]TGY80574.1 TraG family conjugative transposon ATPase [Lepagella muris]
MTWYVILFFAAILIGMAISVAAFGTGGKRKRVFRDIYFSVEDNDGIGVIYTKTGEYSAILEIENPVQKYSADADRYYDFCHLFSAVVQTLGEGYAIHKQDVFSRRGFVQADAKEKEFLSRSYFSYFEGRPYTDTRTCLVITQESKKGKLYSFDMKKWKDFLVKIRKVKDQLRDGGMKVRFLTADECDSYVDRYFTLDFNSPIVTMSNFKVDDEGIGMGDRKCRVFSLVDVDCAGLPSLVRPFTNVEVNNTGMPLDLMSAIDSIPEAETVIYNQMIFIPNQKRELSALEKKKNRHASIPNPSNQIAVEDIKQVQEVVAREGKQLVYTHFNLVVCCPRNADMQKPVNHLENMFGRMGIHISKRAYNQLELFVNSFPGNCYNMDPEYDRFLTLSDAATCLMYKEHVQRSEDTPLKIYYTDRKGMPVAIDITGKEGKVKMTDNSNFFCLGPSGSGKSFHMNSVVRQLHEQGTDVVMVDTGNSYEGLCEYLGGKYISYTEEKPITMNPFKITKEEINIEKINFLKNLILQIWKGSEGIVTKTEDRLIGQAIEEYYRSYFTGKIDAPLSFNSFFDFAVVRIPEIITENELKGIDTADLNYQLRDFYKGGSHETTLNENMDSTLFDETFIVFEIDAIKDDATLFPIVTLIIMDVFLQKMRLKKNRKVLVIEEAWKAIATPLMAEYIKYLYKTARKFWASVGVVTQEIQDIIGSEIVKEAIINNSDVVMLLDQSKFRERFDNIKAILGLTDVDCKKIFTINRLDNKEGRSFFREVFIRRGSTSGVYGVEESHECYMTYTTERAEKDALKLYKSELGCSHQEAIERYCRDWDNSGIAAPLEFARRVYKAGHVLNLPARNDKNNP